MTKRKKKSKKILEKRANQLTADADSWENGDLGNSAAHAVIMKPISIRLPIELIDELRTIAGDEGLRYQSYIRHILTLHVKDKMGN